MRAETMVKFHSVLKWLFSTTKNTALPYPLRIWTEAVPGVWEVSPPCRPVVSYLPSKMPAFLIFIIF